MKQLRLDVDALEVTTYETVQAEAAPVEVLRTGATGFCNTCYRCDWTQ